MKKYVFLILHYISLDETSKCVDSIFKKCKNDNFEIVIVDNGSPNNSCEELKKMYSKNSKIHLIFSKENLGFANGNNLGFKYIKDNLKPDYIIMINNDIIMLQDTFCNLINDEYKKSGFAVLGPKIILRDNTVYSYPEQIPKIKELNKKLRHNKRMYYFNKIHLRFIYSGYDKIKNKIIKHKKFNTDIRKENIVLHGCCLIFSKKYIDKFDGIDNRTFLYYEEPLLYIRLQRNGLKSVYNPILEILHNEGVSTKKSSKNKRKKFDFVLKNEIKSLKILIDELK